MDVSQQRKLRQSSPCVQCVIWIQGCARPSSRICCGHTGTSRGHIPLCGLRSPAPRAARTVGGPPEGLKVPSGMEVCLGLKNRVKGSLPTDQRS